MNAFSTGCALALGLLGLLGSAADAGDALYIDDGSDYTVKRFDAETGVFLGTFVNSGSGGVNGLRGLPFEHLGAVPDVQDLLVKHRQCYRFRLFPTKARARRRLIEVTEDDLDARSIGLWIDS